MTLLVFLTLLAFDHVYIASCLSVPFPLALCFPRPALASFALLAHSQVARRLFMSLCRGPELLVGMGCCLLACAGKHSEFAGTQITVFETWLCPVHRLY